MSLTKRSHSPSGKSSVSVISMVILILTGLFSFTMSMAQARLDKLQANDTQIQPEISPSSPASQTQPTHSTAVLPTPTAEYSPSDVTAIATKVYDQSLGSLKVTLATMIGIIGGGMLLTMLYLGHVDQQRKQRHEILLTNAQHLAQQIQSSAQELRNVYLEARDWERDLSEKMRERYEIHSRKNKQLMEELQSAQQDLQAMEQEMLRVSQMTTKPAPPAQPQLTPASARPTQPKKIIKTQQISGIPIRTIEKSMPASDASHSPSKQPSKVTVPPQSANNPTPDSTGKRQQIINRIHQSFQRELQKHPNHSAIYLNWGNACLKIANKLKGEERQSLLKLAREKWLLAERCHAGTAKRQLSVLNAITGLEEQSRQWAHIHELSQQRKPVHQTT